MYTENINNFHFHFPAIYAIMSTDMTQARARRELTGERSSRQEGCRDLRYGKKSRRSRER